MDLVSSTIALGAAGVGGDDYWFSLHWNNQNGEAVMFYYLDLDSSGNVLLTGDTQKSDIYGTLPNNHKGTAHKLDGTDGSAIWHRFASHQTTYANSDYFSITSDDDDNVYITGTRPYIGSGSDAGNAGMTILKFNSSGALQWQKDNRAKNSGNNWQASSVVRGASNGVTVSAGRDYDNRYGIRLTEIAANGSLSTDKLYVHNSVGYEPSGKDILRRGSTDGYYYVTGSTGNNKNFVAQIRNDWTWRGITFLDSPTGELQSEAIALDDSDNQYILCGRENAKTFFYKITRSNQAVAWQKNLANTFSEYRSRQVACHGSKAYVISTKEFTINSATQECLVLLVFNTSDGSLDSAIRLRNSAAGRKTRGRGIKITDTAIILSAEVYLTSTNLRAGGVFKIPLDLSLTGTYTIPNYDSFVYETYSPSVSASTQNTSTEFLPQNISVSNVSQLSNGNYTIYNVSFTEAQTDLS